MFGFFWFKMVTHWKSLILFGIKSILITKKLIILNLSIINIFKAKTKSYDDEAARFQIKEIPKVDSNHTCSAVININSALKRREKTVLKEWKYIENEKMGLDMLMIT